ncbi:MAG: cystathionine beta-lyase [Pseudomonadota bacterium]
MPKPKTPREQLSTTTKLMHSGHEPRDFHGFVNPPVVHASTVLFENVDSMVNRRQKYLYGTRGTPTTDALADALCELEGAQGTVLVPSGLAAVTVPLVAFASAGGHVLLVDSLYGPTRRFADTILSRMDVEIEYFAPEIGAGISELIRPNTQVLFLEAPGSNSFEMHDTRVMAEAAHAVDAVVMMDNTWATPLFFKPLDHGVDISIHALTKYPSGHSDLVLGSVSANARTWEQLHDTQLTLGVCAAPDDCYLVFRGLKTMEVRLKRHEENALEVARWLNSRPEIARVLHPALPDDPGHEIWKRDFSGSSGLFGFVFDGWDFDKAAAFLDALEFFGLGYSWGGYESLAVIPTFEDRTVSLAPQEGKTIRLQIGLEDPRDLINDLEQALNQVQGG